MYHLNPYQDGYSLGNTNEKRVSNYSQISSPVTASYIPKEFMIRSLTAYSQNNFFKYLCNLFDTPVALALMEKFQIGTSRYWDDATVFWQVDASRRVRTGKVMLYDPITGKRQKQVLADGSKRSLITWVHSILKLESFNLQQCLFGLNQLDSNNPLGPVAIVESEKTAVIATVYLPQFTWLACGSLTNLNKERMAPLKGRQVILFPDLGAYDVWRKKAAELTKDSAVNITVSDLLECRTTEQDKFNGLDLADYLVRLEPSHGWAITDEGYPLFWDNPLSLPVYINKGELFQQEILKYWKQGKHLDVYNLALDIGLELGHAIAICENISTKNGVLFC
jgi:hypothetical protein